MREASHHAVAEEKKPVVGPDCYSSYTRLTCVTAWIQRFIHNCQAKVREKPTETSLHLLVCELQVAEVHWHLFIQEQHFEQEISALQNGLNLHRSSSLILLHPILDQNGLLLVGGRTSNSKGTYTSQHPVIVHSAHPVTRLIIRTEHLRLLHASPTLLSCALDRRYHITGGRKAVRSMTRACVTCRRMSTKPQNQVIGQLPGERVSPDLVFSKVGLDYAGPFYIKARECLQVNHRQGLCLFVCFLICESHPHRSGV